MFQPNKLADLISTATPDPFSLDALITWLRTKPADEVYCYESRGHCLAAQYCAHTGANYHPLLITHLIGADEGVVAAATFLHQLEWIAVKYKRTFGAALSRALALKAQS